MNIININNNDIKKSLLFEYKEISAYRCWLGGFQSVIDTVSTGVEGPKRHYNKDIQV